MTELFSDTLVLRKDAFKDDGQLSGFGMDIGGSIIKVAYPSRAGDDVHINLVAYDLCDLDQALKSLKSKLSGLYAPGSVICTAGYGCSNFSDLINEVLDVRIEVAMELALNAKALRFLADNARLSDIVLPRDFADVREFVKQDMEAARKLLATSSPENPLIYRMHGDPEDILSQLDDVTDSDDVISEAESRGDRGALPPTDELSRRQGIKFPVFLCCLGSASVCTTNMADCSYIFEGAFNSCGKTLMGLGSLLTGATSFAELLSLAEAGDAGRVESRCRDLRREGRQDVYSILPDDLPVYCFGKAQGKTISDFRREDLAAALVSQTALTEAHLCHEAFMSSEGATIVFAGSVCCQSQLIRKEITKHLLIALYSKSKTTKTDVFFLKHGAYLGAIGALLQQNSHLIPVTSSMNDKI